MNLTAWKKWAWVPLLFLVSFVLWIVFRGRRLSPLVTARAELRAIEAEREVQLVQEERGKDQALQYVKEQYLLSLMSLEHDAQAKVKELEHDPPKLAAYLRRIVSSRDLDQ